MLRFLEKIEKTMFLKDLKYYTCLELGHLLCIQRSDKVFVVDLKLF